MIRYLVGRISETRICLVASCRPEFPVPWPPSPAFTELVLSRLAPDEVRDMARYLSGACRLDRDATELVVRQADGIPLFVEELTRFMLRGETARPPGRSDGESHPASAPPTLRDLLVARLDRAGPARPLAQLAAMLGRTFSLELLDAVTEMDSRDLHDRLRRLVQDDILQPAGDPSGTLYRFRHVLIQQAAYESLLKRSRFAHHARIVRALVERFPDLARREPELVAHHFTEAREPGEALPWWQRAARLALEQSANLEARAHLEKGLGLLGQLPANPTRGRLELEMRLALGAAWTTALLGGEPGVAAAQTAAGLELCRAGTPDGHALIYGGHDTAVCANILGAWARWLLGKPDTARHMAGEALIQARGMGHPASLVHALHWGMPVYQFLGDAPAVVAAAREMTELAKQPGLVSAQYRDRACILLGWGLDRLGRGEEGLDLFRQGLSARPADDRHMRPYFHALLAEMLLRRGADDEARELIARVLEMLGETRECWWEPELWRLSGEAAGTADPKQARQHIERALTQARAQRARSLELRAAGSSMRLSVSLGNRPADAGLRLRALYEGFSEGFETADLRQARALLDRVSQGQSPS